MSGPFSSSFAAFQENLAADPDAMTAGLTSDAIFFGGDKVFNHASLPRVVFVPMDGAMTKGVHGAGGITNPRHLETWNIRWDVYCWGTDEDGAFALFQSTVRAVRMAAPGAYSTPSAALMSNNQEVLAAGRAIRFSFVLQIPVVDVTLATTIPPNTATFTPTLT